jgi:large repetitive protein
MGNIHNGIEIDGTAHDILIGGPSPAFNIIPYNVISANGDNGVAITGSAYDIQVNSSYVGTDLSARNAFGNGKAGILLAAGTHGITIGSTNPTFLTVVSGNKGNGVEMRSTTGNTVVGTLIGSDATGLLPLSNGKNGIYISNSSSNLIGRTASNSNGTAGGPANLIAFNTLDAIDVDSGNRNTILGNSILANGQLGIDLGPWSNNSQAASVLTTVTIYPLGMQVAGTVAGEPNSVLTIEFFANDTDAASGRYLLGTQNVQTNASGIATIAFYGPLPPNGASFVTATATDGNGNTSEFSAAAR